MHIMTGQDPSISWLVLAGSRCMAKLKVGAAVVVALDRLFCELHVHEVSPEPAPDLLDVVVACPEACYRSVMASRGDGEPHWRMSMQ